MGRHVFSHVFRTLSFSKDSYWSFLQKCPAKSFSLAIFLKSSIVDIWQGSKYTSVWH